MTRGQRRNEQPEEAAARRKCARAPAKPRSSPSLYNRRKQTGRNTAPYHEGDPQNNHPMIQGMHPTWRCGGCGYTIVTRAEGYCLFCERGLLKPESTRPNRTLYGTIGMPDALPPRPE